ncbi:MAG: type II toxin-antitoxin system VapB family antitoxin [Propionibacteriaceae bacterium]|jgi:antitoxin VapB|nr:type II toxin-antitoxin system VapB family antitoxin [Propionibacteriaceae bacterium]
MTAAVMVSVFMNRKNQAIRIPKTMEFPGVHELEARRDGDLLILRPVRPGWDEFFAMERPDEEFLPERKAVFESDRVEFSK